MSKLIARTVSKLHNEEDVIEINSLEGEAKVSSLEITEELIIGENADVRRLPATSLYRHFLKLSTTTEVASTNLFMVIINSSKNPITSLIDIQDSIYNYDCFITYVTESFGGGNQFKNFSNLRRNYKLNITSFFPLAFNIQKQDFNLTTGVLENGKEYEDIGVISDEVLRI